MKKRTVRKHRSRHIKAVTARYGEVLRRGEPLDQLLERFTYQRILTPRLDGLAHADFNDETVNLIVLWKVNRFAVLPPDLLEDINKLKDIRFKRLEAARPVLERLLETRGFQLAMASTVLRFRNPNVFQIIDKRAFRVVYGSERAYPKKYGKASRTYVDESIDIYFQYLRDLKAVAGHCHSDYSKLDRAFYLLDKPRNRLTRTSR